MLATIAYAELRDRGLGNGHSEARRLLDDYRKLRQTQIALSRELGMTPLARMALKVGRTSGDDLAAALAKPNSIDERKGHRNGLA